MKICHAFGPKPELATPPNQLEAEEATVYGLGFEAIQPGFTGWGYLAPWNADGQWVDVHLSFAKAGVRRLNFRYSQGTGEASRLIIVNGQYAIMNLSFPSTGAWTNYAVVAVDYDFPAGGSTVSVVYYSGAGSHNLLNLDNLTLQIPGPLQIKSDATNIFLSWNGIAALESSPTVNGPWNPVDGLPASPFTLPTHATPQRFYRLRQ